MRKSTLHLSGLAFLLLCVWGPTQPLWAQSEQEGNVCEPPKFSFVWEGNSELSLVINAHQTGAYELKLRPHRSNKADRFWCAAKKPPSCSVTPTKGNQCILQPGTDDWWYVCRVELEKGKDKYLDLDPDDFCLLRSDGQIVIAWDYSANQDTGAKEMEKLCPADQSGQTPPIVALRRHTVAFDSGPVYSLENDGSYESGTELAASAFSRWNNGLSSYADFRFSRIGKIDDGDMGTDDMGTDDMGTDDMGTDDMGTDGMGGDEPFNPFVEGGNVLSVNGAVLIHPWYRMRKKVHERKDMGTDDMGTDDMGTDDMGTDDIGTDDMGTDDMGTDDEDGECERNHVRLVPSFSWVVGGGFTTRPGEATELQAKPKLFTGVRIQVARFNVQAAEDELAGSSGFLQFGYARDELWKFTEVRDADGDPMTVDDQETVEIDEKDRLWFESQLLIPAIGTDSVRLKLRLYADLPVSGDGPSDIRVSALFQFNLGKLASGLK